MRTRCHSRRCLYKGLGSGKERRQVRSFARDSLSKNNDDLQGAVENDEQIVQQSEQAKNALREDVERRYDVDDDGEKDQQNPQSTCPRETVHGEDLTDNMRNEHRDILHVFAVLHKKIHSVEFEGDDERLTVRGAPEKRWLKSFTPLITNCRSGLRDDACSSAVKRVRSTVTCCRHTGHFMPLIQFD